MKIKDMTVEQYINLLLNPKTRVLIDGEYDDTWCKVIDNNRIMIDGTINLNREVELPD